MPGDQLDSVKTSARKQALRNRDTRPKASKSNQDTANNATDTLASSDGKVQSTSLDRKGDGSAEELVREARENRNGPEYKEKGRVRHEFNTMQYRNAAKAGAIGGAVSEGTAILLGVLRSDKPLTRDQCTEAAERVVYSAVLGSGNALLVTGIQHTGQAMIDAAAQQTGKTVTLAVGKQLIKGNVAAALVQITANLAQNLYKFSNGETDSLEFASSAIGDSIKIVGGSLAFGVGSATGAYLGTIVPAAVSGYAIAGTSLGSLGVMASGVAFAIGFAVAAGVYVNHFSTKGVAIAHSDLRDSLELLNGGQINLSTYLGKIGTMSKLNFNWNDILPFSGSISVISEYEVRKNKLLAIQSDIRSEFDTLSEQEREVMQELAKQYAKAIDYIDRQYKEARADITRQASVHFDALGTDMNRHLETHYLMFAPVRKAYIEHSGLMDIEERKQLEKQKRLQAFDHEIKALQGKLEGLPVSDQTDRALKDALKKTVLTRMEMLIPTRTSWDHTCEFLELR